MKQKRKISIAIVSYNVREFLYQCLLSVSRASANLEAEILIVDNASVDGSVQMVKQNYPAARLIENKQNVGFAAANNQALKQATGEFFVMLNPDTIVQEDTFEKLISFFDKTPDAGIAGCKILNPDGSFSVDSRHSIPSPMTALWKMFGLNRLFPGSKIFGRYNMTYLDADEIAPVDAISGSFMMFRNNVFLEAGGLDEDYFMYCEDIDLCYRVAHNGWKVYYVPETNIIHYKGESTKKNNIDYVINFNRSLYLFYKKHFHRQYLSLFRWFILLGVMIRGIILYIRNFIRAHFALLLDILILNTIYFVTFYLRYEMRSGFYMSDFLNQYIFINLLSSLIFIGSSVFMELYGKYKLSLIQTFKTNVITLLILSALTFFINQLAFSRMVVISAASAGTLLMILWRIILRYFGKRSGNTFSNSFFQRRLVLVGTGDETVKLIKKMRTQIPADFTIEGVISESPDEIGRKIQDVPVVTDIRNMSEFISLEKIDEVIFSSHEFSYATIIATISAIDNPNIDFKIVPENLEVIIGKSSIETIGEYQLVDIDFPAGKSFNKITKRMFDFMLSLTFIIFSFPIFILLPFFPGKYKQKFEMDTGHGNRLKITQVSENINQGLVNKILLLPHILTGGISFVGSTIRAAGKDQPSPLFKPGLTGLTQINHDATSDDSDAQKYDIYYVRNQSFWLDIEIMIKSIFR